MSNLKEPEMPELTADTLDDQGVMRLFEAILEQASRDYVDTYRAYETTGRYDPTGHLYNDLRMMERFFKWSPFMCLIPLSSEDVIRTLRKKAMKGYTIQTQKDPDGSAKTGKAE